jgi:hypothetical protein
MQFRAFAPVGTEWSNVGPVTSETSWLVELPLVVDALEADVGWVPQATLDTLVEITTAHPAVVARLVPLLTAQRGRQVRSPPLSDDLIRNGKDSDARVLPEEIAGVLAITAETSPSTVSQAVPELVSTIKSSDNETTLRCGAEALLSLAAANVEVDVVEGLEAFVEATCARDPNATRLPSPSWAQQFDGEWEIVDRIVRRSVEDRFGTDVAETLDDRGFFFEGRSGSTTVVEDSLIART